MSQQLERTIRSYIARATGVTVIPGNSPGPRPIGVYASLLTMRDERTSEPVFHQVHDASGLAAGTVTATHRRRTFSLQFYRDGAMDMALRFTDYSESENGLVDAATTFASYGGRIRRLTLYDPGSYSSAPDVSISAPAGSGAIISAILGPGSGHRPISSLSLDSAGRDYVDLTPVAPLRVNVSSADANATPATATAQGWGFTVEAPLPVRRLDSIIGDEFEERAQIDLPILYSTLETQETGGIDANDCELIDGQSGVRLITLAPRS